MFRRISPCFAVFRHVSLCFAVFWVFTRTHQLLTTATTNMAAANFVVITNGGGARLLEQPISTNSVPRDFFPRVAIGCRLLGGVLIGGYMRWYSVNRRYGIWYFVQICAIKWCCTNHYKSCMALVWPLNMHAVSGLHVRSGLGLA